MTSEEREEMEDLHVKLQEQVDRMRQFLDENEDENGELPEEALEDYKKMEKVKAALQNKIARRKAIIEAREQTTASVNGHKLKDVLNYPNSNGFGKVGRASDEYRKAAIEAIRQKCRVITNALATDPASAGGFLIPTEWDTRLIKSLEEENVIRQLGTTITTASEHKISRVATKPAAAWLDEGQSITFGNGTFDQVTLDAHKVGIGILVSEELLADSMFDIETEILDQFSKAIANAEEDAFLNGAANANMPTGIITTVAANPTMYITTKGAEPTADEIIDLSYKLPRPYRKNAVFLMNDSTLATIKKFKDQTQRYIWEESYQAGEPSRLLGYPVYTSPYMPTIASGTFPILFGDFSYYNIADRGARTIQELREAYAVSGQIGFLMKERCDGILIDNDAVRALKIK